MPTCTVVLRILLMWTANLSVTPSSVHAKINLCKINFRPCIFQKSNFLKAHNLLKARNKDGYHFVFYFMQIIHLFYLVHTFRSLFYLFDRQKNNFSRQCNTVISGIVFRKLYFFWQEKNTCKNSNGANFFSKYTEESLFDFVWVFASLATYLFFI